MGSKKSPKDLKAKSVKVFDRRNRLLFGRQWSPRLPTIVSWLLSTWQWQGRRTGSQTTVLRNCTQFLFGIHIPMLLLRFSCSQRCMLISMLYSKLSCKSLVATCIENVVELLRSNFSKEVIYEVAAGGIDGALQPLAGRLDALDKPIASLAALLPKISEAEEEHILRTFTPAGPSENLSWTAPLLSHYGI